MNFKLGYYKVADKIFADKIEAVLYASSIKADYSWHFNNEIFDAIDWTIEPELSLDDFYRLRAQQIRDEYDYVIILCSGGGDSTNVAYSFLRNGIHVDEIIASAPISGLNLWQSSDNTNDAGNTMSETLLVQLPLMAEIKQQYPNVKITINDYFKNLINYETDEWIFRSGEWIHPTSAARYDLEELTHIKNLAEQGKKIGIVYGIDKPNIMYKPNGNIEMSMNDLAVNVQRPPFKNKYPNVENVLFYYAPELPLMIAKQVHVLARWIHMPENSVARSYMGNQKKIESVEQGRIRHSFFERAIIPCIYPSTHRKIFQGHKPTRMFLGEHDDWFYSLHNQTRTYELIESDFRNFYKAIDPFYLNRARSGFRLFRLTYDIGPTSKFLPSIIN